jgi:hypothetical protein
VYFHESLFYYTTFSVISCLLYDKQQWKWFKNNSSNRLRVHPCNTVAYLHSEMAVFHSEIAMSCNNDHYFEAVNGLVTSVVWKSERTLDILIYEFGRSEVNWITIEFLLLVFRSAYQVLNSLDAYCGSNKLGYYRVKVWYCCIAGKLCGRLGNSLQKLYP